MTPINTKILIKLASKINKGGKLGRKEKIKGKENNNKIQGIGDK